MRMLSMIPYAKELFLHELLVHKLFISYGEAQDRQRITKVMLQVPG